METCWKASDWARPETNIHSDRLSNDERRNPTDFPPTTSPMTSTEEKSVPVCVVAVAAAAVEAEPQPQQRPLPSLPQRSVG